jgi:hypothetical protein
MSQHKPYGSILIIFFFWPSSDRSIGLLVFVWSRWLVKAFGLNQKGLRLFKYWPLSLRSLLAKLVVGCAPPGNHALEKKEKNI